MLAALIVAPAAFAIGVIMTPAGAQEGDPPPQPPPEEDVVVDPIEEDRPFYSIRVT